MAQYDGTSLPMIFHSQAEKLGNKACISYKKNDNWYDISWTEMQNMVIYLAAYLDSKGIKKGDRVAIFSYNRYEWWVADQASLAIGAITVPIYSTNSEEESLYILKDSGAKCCFTGTQDHFNKITNIKKKASALKMIIPFECDKKARGLVLFSDALKIGSEKVNIQKITKSIKSIKRDSIATIIYTSGTTGAPKGAVLTHGNIISDIKNTFVDMAPFFSEDDIFMSFLPLSHVLERMAGYYTPISVGAKVAFAEGVSKLLENMVEVRPTILISVPRIFEKIHAGINIQVKTAPAAKKLIFSFATSTAAKNLKYVCRRANPPFPFSLRLKIAEKIVFKTVRQKIGFERLKFAFSGGGPLSSSDAEFFIGMGIEIIEGFGLTETSPITNVNRPGEIVIGSVGRALSETIVKISDDGEILVKGPQVMKGYYKKASATKKAFTADGFFKTGDIGRIDEKGLLYITGRNKDIIVTSGGKNISPQNIENMLKGSPYIEQVALIGDRRKFISALIVPDFKVVEKWSKKKGLTHYSIESMCKDPSVRLLFEKEIERLTGSCSRVEKIKKFVLIPNEWSQDGGELTPSQKIKRMVIETKYGKIIDSIYEE